jgi:hypothetical protein
VRRWSLAVAALLVTGVVVWVGLSGRDVAPTADRSPSATPTPTPLSSVDLSGLPIERAPFCDRLEEADVEKALGGPVSGTTHYDSGDRVALASGLRDVSHEFDCTYDAALGSQARVWVFAEPVTTTVARTLAREARAEKGCSVLRDAPTYGTPAAATLCRTTGPVGRVVTLRGLFGDAWTTCRLSTPGPSGATGTVERAEQWCVRVATTLGARP